MVLIGIFVKGYAEKVLRLIIRFLLTIVLIYIFITLSFKLAMLIGDLFLTGSDIISNVLYHMFLATSLVFSFYFSPIIEEFLFEKTQRKKDSSL